MEQAILSWADDRPARFNSMEQREDREFLEISLPRSCILVARWTLYFVSSKARASLEGQKRPGMDPIEESGWTGMPHVHALASKVRRCLPTVALIGSQENSRSAGERRACQGGTYAHGIGGVQSYCEEWDAPCTRGPPKRVDIGSIFCPPSTTPTKSMASTDGRLKMRVARTSVMVAACEAVVNGRVAQRGDV